MKRYSAYKPSGVEWIGDIPEKWKIMPFKYCMTINNGADYKDIEDSDGYPVFGSGGSFAFAKKYMYDGEVVFLGRKGTVDKPLYYNGKFWAIDTMFYAIPQRNVSCKYMYYHALTFPFDFYLTDTARPSMTQTDLGDNKIAGPPKDEQVAIAAYLDAKCAKIDNVLSVQQKRIELLKELKQSIITNVVTKGLDKNVEFKPSGIEWIGDISEKWEVGKIKFYSTLHNGDRSSEYPNAKELVDEGVLFLTSNNIHNLILDVSNVQNKYITDEKYKRLGGAKICLNDIVFCLRGSIGNCSINTSISKGTVASSLVVIRPNRINAFFLNYALHSNIVESQTCIAMNGSCAANLSAENVGNYYIAIPPKDVQEHITFYLNKKCSAIDNQISKIERQIELLKEYKQSIITECVTGKRKVC